MDAYVHSTPQQLVSLHAVARYCERFLGVQMTKPAGIGPVALATAYCDAAGTTVEDVQERLCTPAARRALEIDVPYFATGGVGYVVGGNGIIVTVVVPHQRDRHRMKVLSERELRKKLNRMNRRNSGKFPRYHDGI